MRYILFIIFSSIIWCWRGSKYTIGNYPTAIIASGLIMLFYNCIVLHQPVSLNVLWATLALVVCETCLGYGEATSYLNTNSGQLCKELWIYLGLISLCYAVFPFIMLNVNRLNYNILLVALAGLGIFPLAKYVDIYLQHVGFKYDTWKIAEMILGSGIAIALLIGRLL